MFQIKITHQEEDGPQPLKTSPFEMLSKRTPSPVRRCPSPQIKRDEKTSKICTTIEIDGKQSMLQNEGFVKANTARKQLLNRGVKRQKNVNEDTASNGLMFEEDGLHETSSKSRSEPQTNRHVSEGLLEPVVVESNPIPNSSHAVTNKDFESSEPAIGDKMVKENQLSRKSSKTLQKDEKYKVTEETDDLFKPIGAENPVKKSSLPNGRKPSLNRKGSKTSDKFDEFNKRFHTDKPIKRHSLPTAERPKQPLVNRKFSEVSEQRHNRSIGPRSFKKYPSIIDEDADIYEEESSLERRKYSRDENQLRNQSHINTKKISEMQYQFDDARVRIDKLLRRTTSSRDRDYEFDRASLYSNSSYDLSDKQLERSNSSDSSGPTMHKTEVHVNPKKLLREVSISIKCEQEVK